LGLALGLASVAGFFYGPAGFASDDGPVLPWQPPITF